MLTGEVVDKPPPPEIKSVEIDSMEASDTQKAKLNYPFQKAVEKSVTAAECQLSAGP